MNGSCVKLEKLTSQLVTDCKYIATATKNTITDKRKKTAGLSSLHVLCRYSLLMAYMSVLHVRHKKRKAAMTADMIQTTRSLANV